MAHSIESKVELGPLANDTLHWYTTTQIFNYRFANAQS